MTQSPDLKSKFLGSMLGSALGDAVGELAFRDTAEDRLQAIIAKQEHLVYTDDTAMAIGLAESIIESQGLDSQHLGRTFHANYRQEPWRGYASGPPTIFSTVEEEKIPYTEAAQRLFRGSGSFGNGAAMRIAPAGLYLCDAPDRERYQQARTSAAVTHAHPIGIDGAAVLAWAIGQAVCLDPEGAFPLDEFARGFVSFARTSELQKQLYTVRELIKKKVSPAKAAWDWQLGSGVAMHHSLPFALYAFLRHPDDYEKCIFCAIRHGGDRDTLGAMAGAVSGAYLGVEALPQNWIAKLENRAYIESLALQLLELKQQWNAEGSS